MRREADVYAIGDAMPKDDTVPFLCRKCDCDWRISGLAVVAISKVVCPGCGRVGSAVIVKSGKDRKHER